MPSHFRNLQFVHKPSHNRREGLIRHARTQTNARGCSKGDIRAFAAFRCAVSVFCAGPSWLMAAGERSRAPTIVDFASTSVSKSCLMKATTATTTTTVAALRKVKREAYLIVEARVPAKPTTRMGTSARTPMKNRRRP